MKVLVLGATGGTGREIVKQASEKGYHVVALVRSLAKAQGLGAARLVEGDARDSRVLEHALADCDSAICCLGTGISPFKTVTTLSEATRSLVTAMNAGAVRRLVCITGIGAGDSRGHGGFVYDRIVLPLLLRTVYDDKDRQEAAIRSSGLDWTIIRPAMLANGPRTGRYRVLLELEGVTAGKISRADVAAFTVDQLSDRTYLGKTPLITD